MGRQYRVGRPSRGARYARAGIAGGVRPGAPDRPMGRALGDCHFSHLSGATYAAVHSTLEGRGDARASGYDLVAGGGLSELYDPLLDMVADGLFQVDP